MPHTPCTPNTSQVSSTLSHFLRVTTPHRPATPPTRPITNAPPTPTVPHAGVIATRPAIAPELAPSREGLPRTIHSTKVQERIAPAVAMKIGRKASAAMELAALAEPALKPNQPTYRIEAPVKTIGRLCGLNASLPKPTRLPNR